MSRFVRQSQLRNLAVDGYGADAKFTELQTGDVPTHGNLISASPKYVAFVASGNSASSVSVVDVTSPGKYHGLNSSSCQQGSIYDLEFAPHGLNILASGAGNGSVALWSASGSGRDVNIESVGMLGATNGARAQAVRWHPSADGVISVLRGSDLEIWDSSSTSRPLYSTAMGCAGKAKALDAAWSPSGNMIASLNDDKSLQIMDPRQDKGVAAVEKAHMGPRSLGRIINGGVSGHHDLEHLFYSTGFNMTRDRELAVWDARKMDSCVVRHKVASGGTGVLIPIMSPDLKILFIVGKGETSVRAYEASNASPFVYSLSQNTTSSDPLLGITSLPPSSCDIMGCEVTRLLKLAPSSIEPIRVEVPRRKKSFFHDDLFPDTADLTKPAMSANEWWEGGQDASQPLVPVRDLRSELGLGSEKVMDERSDLAAVGSILANQELAAEDKRQQEEAIAAVEAADAEAENAAYQETDLDKRMSLRRGYVPKFKFAKGTQAKREETVYNLTVGPQPCVSVGAQRFAVPWQGGGGPVHVGNLKDVGKINAPERAPVINGHSKPVFCLDFAPTDPSDRTLATGSDDCNIRVWRLPEDNGALETDSTSEALKGHQSSVRQVLFHPAVSNILASGSQDSTVRLWDVNKAACVELAHRGDEMITSLVWNYPGSLLAMIDRANCLRISDPRVGHDSANPFTIDKVHAGAKPCFVTWLGDSPYVLTSGCARMGYREFSIWDARKAGARALHTTKVNNGATSLEPLYVEDNGVVIFTSRGENTFHIYEIETLTRAAVKPEHCGSDPLKPHPCQEFLARGEPTTAIALAPRRVCDTSSAEWAKVLRLTPSALEPVSFTVPRATGLVEYFADDIYSDARKGVAASDDPDAWLGGKNFDPVLVSLNSSDAPCISERDPNIARQSLKRAQDNTRRFRAEKEAEEARQKAQHDVFARMQFLAVQHEAYNPNLSGGEAAVPKSIARSLGVRVDEEHIDTGDVADEEWDD